MRDRRAAAIYAADKLANTREILDAGERVRAERLDHCAVLCDGRPDLPFLTELSEELALLVDRGPTGLRGADQEG
jgi:hypothetical protein